VGIHLESIGCDGFDPFGAAVDVERSFTIPANEVVVVGTAGKLIPNGIPRYLHCRQPPLLYQPLDVPVHRGDSKRCGESLPSLDNLFRYQRTT